jgi:hypothetical protein
MRTSGRFCVLFGVALGGCGTQDISFTGVGDRADGQTVTSSSGAGLLATGGAGGGGGRDAGGSGGTPINPVGGPFVVSDYFAPTGAMGDAATPGNLVISVQAGCKSRPAGARGNCYSFQYVASNPYTTPITKSRGVCSWAGVVFQYPDNNWGTSEGLPIASGKLSKVSAWVALASGNEEITFGAGGMGSPPDAEAGAGPSASMCPPSETPRLPNYDVLSSSSTQEIGTDWTRIEIPILSRDPSAPVPATTNLIGAFLWAMSSTPGLPKTVYLDDLVYE